jgi:HlyD family secretion protein
VAQARKIQGKSAELIERRIAAEDPMKRVEIRSPSVGFVHQLAVHRVGGVITPAELATLIVPAEDGLELEARINPPDIDQIAPGELTRLGANRVSAGMQADVLVKTEDRTPPRIHRQTAPGQTAKAFSVRSSVQIADLTERRRVGADQPFKAAMRQAADFGTLHVCAEQPKEAKHIAIAHR